MGRFKVGYTFTPYTEEPKRLREHPKKIDWGARLGALRSVPYDWWCIGLWYNASSAHVHKKFLQLQFPEYEFASVGSTVDHRSKLYARRKLSFYSSKPNTKERKTLNGKATKKRKTSR